jgi:alpha-galactosidase
LSPVIELAQVSVDERYGRVYEHGWQSWSPSTDHPAGGTGLRPLDAQTQLMGFRPGVRLVASGFQGEGLLAVLPAPGEPVQVYAAASGEAVPSIRAELVAPGRLRISSDRPDSLRVQVLPGPLYAALGAWADEFAGVRELRPAPTVWCSWYRYYGGVTVADIDENMDAIDRQELPVDVIQIDDGWAAELGDWLEPSTRFGSLAALAGRIHRAGRRAGIWVAPFLAGSRSRLARTHPDWLAARIGPGWRQDVYTLDLTRADVHRYLTDVVDLLIDAGFDYLKLDFLFAGAMSGLSAYRNALRLIRRTAGPGCYLVGCGAPILPSVGLVDAMRVAPDIAPHYEPLVDDLSSYSQRAATLTTMGRAWQHGRFWVNDPDCLIARRAVERREDWASVIRRYGGLRASSDRIADLDDWGLATTRELLSTVPPPTPFALGD